MTGKKMSENAMGIDIKGLKWNNWHETDIEDKHSNTHSSI